MMEHRIGPATLYLGDAREVLPSLLAVDFIFADPPFGHNNGKGDLLSSTSGDRIWGKVNDARPILQDSPEEANSLIRFLFAEARRLLPPGGCCCCCCCGGGPDPQFARWSLWLDELLGFKQMIVWDKGPMGMGWHYRRSYETVLVGEKPGGKCHWYDTTGAVENIIRPGSFNVNKILPRADQHPTEKPVALAAHFIRLHSLPGEVVLDPCMGSCSTGEAAILLGRKFIGVELDEHWFYYAKARIEKAVDKMQNGLFPARETGEQEELAL